MSELAHKTAQVGSMSLHYVEAGSGPLVVLLHGFPEFWYSWRKQIPALVAAGYRVIAPDLRGYNDSSKPEDVAAYHPLEVARDVAGLIAQSGDSPCAVVGHDWGGLAAWLVAMAHPGVVSQLVVMNAPHPVPYGRELRRSSSQKLRAAYQLFFAMPLLPRLLLRPFLPMVMRRMTHLTSGELAEYKAVWRKPKALQSMLNYYRALKRYRRDLRGAIKRIDVPSMLVWGERDPVFIRATTEAFGEWVPDLRVERIPQAGHFVQNDAAEKVNELLLAFLRATRPTAP
jgi:pimeloyl-ACP methyl ester carboxylesterase